MDIMTDTYVVSPLKISDLSSVYPTHYNMLFPYINNANPNCM